MSYAAVFAIIWIYPKFQRFWQPKNWLVKKVWQLLSVSLAAQLGVLPLSLFYFHQFPALFFISNLVVVPFLGVILGLGLLVLGLTYFNGVPSLLVSLYDKLIGTMNAVVAWAAQQETFLFTDIPFDKVQLILGYALVLGLVTVSSRINFRNLTFFLSTLVIFSGYLVFVKWSGQNKEELWLLHQHRNTILLHQNGSQLNVFALDSTRAKRPIQPFEVAQRIKSVKYDSLQNHYKFKSNKLFIIDSLGLYGATKNPDYVLLSQSPKIHFDRFLDSVRPKTVLADGSNYKSYIARWKATCNKRKLPFHYTGEKGAYRFSVKD
jgi:competence protein ComEC